MNEIQQGEIAVTENAASEIKSIMLENQIDDKFGLRVGIKGGGCSGFTYSLGFDNEVKESDTIIEDKGVKIIVDGKSLFYLMGTELDFSGGLNGKGFVFNNPNANKTCGCGESFAV